MFIRVYCHELSIVPIISSWLRCNSEGHFRDWKLVANTAPRKHGTTNSISNNLNQCIHFSDKKYIVKYIHDIYRLCFFRNFLSRHNSYRTRNGLEIDSPSCQLPSNPSVASTVGSLPSSPALAWHGVGDQPSWYGGSINWWNITCDLFVLCVLFFGKLVGVGTPFPLSASYVMRTDLDWRRATWKKVTTCPFSHGVLAKKEHIQHCLRQNNSINQPFKTSANHGALSIKSTINDNCAELLYCNYCEHLVTPVQSINVGTLINDNGMKSLTLRTLWHPKRLCGWLGALRSFLETSTMLWMVLLRSGLLNTADSVD